MEAVAFLGLQGVRGLTAGFRNEVWYGKRNTKGGVVVV